VEDQDAETIAGGDVTHSDVDTFLHDFRGASTRAEPQVSLRAGEGGGATEAEGGVAVRTQPTGGSGYDAFESDRPYREVVRAQIARD